MNVYEVEFTMYSNHEWTHEDAKKIVLAENETKAKAEITKMSDYDYERTVKSIRQIKVGDKIKIIKMVDVEKYNNAKGTITEIDDMGQLRGTWGGLAVIPEVDEFEVIR